MPGTKSKKRNTQACQNLKEPAGTNKIAAEVTKLKQELSANFYLPGMAFLSTSVTASSLT